MISRIRLVYYSFLWDWKAQTSLVKPPITKKIVEQHGGTISVETAPDKGTSFHVELPLRQEQ
jgi:light-regulated signal transduction histidine kinase (bacteriophytochrome)